MPLWLLGRRALNTHTPLPQRLRVDATVVRTVIAGPAPVFARAGPVSRTIIADRPGAGGTWIVRSAVARLSVVCGAEIVEYKRKRERDPVTNTLGPGGELGRKNQSADKEQKNQQPFHLGVNL